MGFEVDDIEEVLAELRSRGLQLEPLGGATFAVELEVKYDVVTVPDNYPSKGRGERGAFFRDSEGNLLAIGQATA